MGKYIYTADIPCHVVIEFKGEKRHLSLHKNEVYELPDTEKVKRLIAKGLIQEFKSDKLLKK